MFVKKSEEISVDYYYNYFPLEVNSWVEYDVIDITHSDFGSDTLIYQLKEIITEEFLDNSGRLTYRIERFIKDSTNSNWTIKDIWYDYVTHYWNINNRVKVSGQHYMWTLRDGWWQWIIADQLKVGDSLLNRDLSVEEITSKDFDIILN